MPRHNFAALEGTLTTIKIRSKALEGNLLGDPAIREVALYLPHDAPADGVPLLVDLTGYTGSGLAHIGWKAFGESVPQRVERLRREGKIGAVAVAFPDCFTALGGNQYINNPVLGNWEDFILEEMLPALEKQFPLQGGAAGRALFGKSSGGYAAYRHAFFHGDRWGGVASLSGDVGFDLLFDGEWPNVLRTLAEYGGVEGFMKAFHESAKVKGEHFHILMMLGLAATYDPDPDAPFGVRLPVDERTCAWIEERRENWRSHDPLRWVDDEAARESASKLNAFYIDCGKRDQYNLIYGSRRMHDALDRCDIDHRYEEFDDNHSGIDYRMDTALPWLWSRLWSEG